MVGVPLRFLRYPGGKQRLIDYILPHLPSSQSIKGRFVEPFVGSAAVFFALNPRSALLSDINPELIDLYRGIRRYPREVWRLFSTFPQTKKGYYQVRDSAHDTRNLAFHAARILYLNRTCFRGMWRQNSVKRFNVGYGGEDRRWVVSEETLLQVSKRLRHARLRCSDFENVITESTAGDFVFVDPPYKPGQLELLNSHYVYHQFSLQDHARLASALSLASQRGARWAMTTSSHPTILRSFQHQRILPLPLGVGSRPGLLVRDSGEVLVCNFEEGSK